MKLITFWNKHGYAICAGIAIIIIIIASLLRIGKKGKWNNYNFVYKDKIQKSNKPPKESKGEKECKRVLEKIFNKPFNKIRPDILNNPVTGGNNLEIDCYNDDLKLGIEYSGIQHYKYSPFFHKTKDAFHNQKYRDYMKRDLCEKNGITLIEVPYTVSVEQIESYLTKKLRERSYIK